MQPSQPRYESEERINANTLIIPHSSNVMINLVINDNFVLKNTVLFDCGADTNCIL